MLAPSLQIVFLPVPLFDGRQNRANAISSYVVYCHDFGLFSVQDARLISCGVSYGRFGQLAVISVCYKPILGTSFKLVF